ncbi:hypothetical protein FRC10_004645 [Ceratobasidium sp. 414]|nr:hypothetical protein FRC10_004645 [Ceratobasidium sp. 414]
MEVFGLIHNSRKRKARSSSHSAVKQSRRAGKNLRKYPAIKGPKVLQDAWDKKKTVRQNYEALGLVHTMNPVAHGGTENLASTPKPEPAASPAGEATPSKPIPQRFGRIIRDENGAVLRIELPEETEQGQTNSRDKGKGRAVETRGDAMDDSDEETEKMIPAEALSWVHIGGNAPKDTNPNGLGIGPKKGGKELVTALEKLSASGVKIPRHASAHEIVWLKDLVATHGRDINAMAHDLKRNVWQKTPGELKRAPAFSLFYHHDILRDTFFETRYSRVLESFCLYHMAQEAQTIKDLHAASAGFKALLNDDVEGAKKALSEGSSPFHLLGLGVVNFLQAALGMEEGLMPDAVASLTAAEAGAKVAAKAIRSAKGSAPSRYPVGMEHEICQADAIVLLGLTQALGESYMGYLQCIAHGKFGKIYKQVFPHGLGSYGTPAQTPMMSRTSSTANLTSSAPASTNESALPTPSSGTSSAASSIVNGKVGNAPTMPIPTVKGVGGLFGRLTGKSNSSQITLSAPSTPIDRNIVPDGPVEELIVAGAAFGFGLFNLVFSLLPNKVKAPGLSIRPASRARSVECRRWSRERCSQFVRSLVLMTYNGVVLLLTGWQADEERVVKQYREILQSYVQPARSPCPRRSFSLVSVEHKYPYGSLWLLNRAKLQRMTFNPSKAIEILEGGLSAERPVKFRQADALLLFELAWTLLADRRYEEAAESFLKIKELNSWSHATYTFIAAGCYLSLAREKPEFKTKARALIDLVPQLLDRKKIGGRDLPTEVFIQKRIDFYKRKQARRAGPGTENDYMDSIFISPAEGEHIFRPRNTPRARFADDKASRFDQNWQSAHIANLVVLSPVISTASGSFTEEKASNTADLDTGDEIAIRHLLLGVLHRAAGEYALARAHLDAVVADEGNVEGKWSGQVSKFELAVNDLREVPGGANRDRWATALKAATTHLDQAVARGGAGVDLSSRLDSRIALLRDEIEVKMQTLGLK